MPHFIFFQQISVLNILNMLYNFHFFSSKCRLFHNATLFGFCITHILNTGVLKFKKKVRCQKVKGSCVLTAYTNKYYCVFLGLYRCSQYLDFLASNDESRFSVVDEVSSVGL